MLPASEYSLARWKNTSTSWSSSRMATFVSWRFAEITSSLLMKNSSLFMGENGSIKETEGLLPGLAPGDPEDRCPGLPDYKIFGPLESGDAILNTPLRRSTKKPGNPGRGTRGRQIELAYPQSS